MANDMVTRCARAIYEVRNGHGCTPWSRIPEAHKAPYLSDARAVLKALMGHNVVFRCADGSVAHELRGAPNDIWQQMLSAALSQEDRE